MRWLPLLVLVACDKGVDTDDEDGVGSTPVCDGRQQTEEAEIDAPFDADGDGFFDAADEGCAETWPPSRLDCDDTDPLINPTMIELPCNGVDEDCSDFSPDDIDDDGDGVGVCDNDCNDQDASVNPNAVEECFDFLDNDCDGIADNDCGANYGGRWIVTPDDISYNCSILGTPVYDLELSELFLTYLPPNSTLSSATAPLPPAMDGAIDPDTGVFTFETVLGTMFGECTQTFRLEGTFTSDTTMEGTFSYSFVSTLPLACQGCAVQETVHEFTAVKE